MGPDASPDPVPPLWEGKLEWDGSNESLTIKNFRGAEIRNQSQAGDQQSSIENMPRNLWSGTTAVLEAPTEIDAVGSSEQVGVESAAIEI